MTNEAPRAVKSEAPVAQLAAWWCKVIECTGDSLTSKGSASGAPRPRQEAAAKDDCKRFANL